MNDPESLSYKLARFIRNNRDELHLTQEELSEKSGIDYKHIQRLESYIIVNDPKITTLIKLANAFNVPVEELVAKIAAPLKESYSPRNDQAAFYLNEKEGKKKVDGRGSCKNG